MKVYKHISWIAVFCWMAIIFYLSHQPGSVSSQLSSGIVAALLSVFEGVVSQLDMNIESFHTFVRKNAHFFAYFILGLLSLNAWKSSGVRGVKQLMLGFGISVLYAITDEVHQLFIKGRSGEIRDVLIDSGGVGLSVIFQVIFGKLWILQKEKTIKRNLK
ncbi:VanZ family protein [Planococcus donghaensis MPA1U2]|uniref:VanZ family protein n=1 Tax=Planococcus donghaensis MPA1U2 TaxID=933115 RepID=E7RG34_9BACL|nr:VanZ family protein [Planococcus donghaensis]EGA90041.1 VanZ family protein [Planococcus donghaensis MPA1U2]